MFDCFCDVAIIAANPGVCWKVCSKVHRMLQILQQIMSHVAKSTANLVVFCAFGSKSGRMLQNVQHMGMHCVQPRAMVNRQQPAVAAAEREREGDDEQHVQHVSFLRKGVLCGPGPTATISFFVHVCSRKGVLLARWAQK